MPIPNADKIWMYRMMSLCRRFEEGAAEAYAEGFIGGFMHLYIGQEAVATGAITSLNHDDFAIATYRDHAHALVRESSPRELMAELYGRSTGVCKGKGGSMHFYDAERYFLGGYAIVGGNLPIAVGLGLAVQLQGEDRVVMAFMGDGATNQGARHRPGKGRVGRNGSLGRRRNLVRRQPLGTPARRVQAVEFPGLGIPHLREEIPADAAHHRLDHPQHRVDGNRGIHRGAAPLENLDAHASRQGMRGCDHAVAGIDDGSRAERLKRSWRGRRNGRCTG